MQPDKPATKTITVGEIGTARDWTPPGGNFTRHYLKFFDVDGAAYETSDDNVKEQLEDALTNKTPMVIEYKQGKYNLTVLTMRKESEPAPLEVPKEGTQIPKKSYGKSPEDIHSMEGMNGMTAFATFYANREPSKHLKEAFDSRLESAWNIDHKETTPKTAIEAAKARGAVVTEEVKIPNLGEFYTQAMKKTGLKTKAQIAKALIDAGAIKTSADIEKADLLDLYEKLPEVSK